LLFLKHLYFRLLGVVRIPLGRLSHHRLLQARLRQQRVAI
jgi:hypothetical protein